MRAAGKQKTVRSQTQNFQQLLKEHGEFFLFSGKKLHESAVTNVFVSASQFIYSLDFYS
jgi:hypothetical protein